MNCTGALRSISKQEPARPGSGMQVRRKARRKGRAHPLRWGDPSINPEVEVSMTTPGLRIGILKENHLRHQGIECGQSGGRKGRQSPQHRRVPGQHGHSQQQAKPQHARDHRHTAEQTRGAAHKRRRGATEETVTWWTPDAPGVSPGPGSPIPEP